MHDLQLALRQFRKSPGFVATIILTISLGIGANTAILNLFQSAILGLCTASATWTTAVSTAAS